MQVVLAVDIGTTSICVLALDASSRQVIMFQSTDNESSINDLPKGYHEQDPNFIWGTVQKLIGQALTYMIEHQHNVKVIKAIVVTGQMHGILLIDDELHPCTNLITWRDQRVADTLVIDELRSNVEISSQCGCMLGLGYGGSIVHWLKINTPELFERDLRALSIVDFVVAQLTGKVATDVTMAASWGILDIQQSRWNESLLSELQLPKSILPEIRPSATPFSTLLPQYHRLWSLNEDVHVCTGLGDNQATVLAMGTLKPGTCVINIGTGAQISIVKEDINYKQGLETRPLTGNRYMYVGSSLYGGWSFAYLGKFFQAVLQQFSDIDISLEQVMDHMNEIGDTASDDAAGLMSNIDFMENRTNQNIKGLYQGIDTSNLTPANFCRATVNAIIDELYEFYKLAGLPISALYVAGNAIKHNTLLYDTIARKWRMSTNVSEHREDAALGVAYLAAVNMGLMKLDSLD